MSVTKLFREKKYPIHSRLPTKNRIKYLVINLAKEVKGFHKNNPKALKNETKEDILGCKDLSGLWIGRIGAVK